MYFPNRAEFHQFAKEGNLIPVTLQILADFETPLSVYLKLKGKQESFIFESVEGGEHIGRYSFVGCNPRLIVRQSGSEVVVKQSGVALEKFQVSASQSGPGFVRDGLAALELVMQRFHPVHVPGLPRFTGGAVGFIGYEFIHDVEPVVPKPPVDDLKTPTLYFFVAEQLVIFDRVKQTITLLANASLEGKTVDQAYDEATRQIDSLLESLSCPMTQPPVLAGAEVPDLPIQSNLTKEKFFENVRRAKEFILQGDIIQVVGSQRFPLNEK